MKTRLKAALIGGVVVGMVAALLYANQAFLTFGGLLSGLAAAYLYLWWRPPASKSLYGNGALVGLLAGLFGGVAMGLVAAVVGNTEVDEGGAALFIFACVFVYSILGPIGGLFGMAIFGTHSALNNSNTSQIVAVLGSALIGVGTFLPVFGLPLVGPRSMASFIFEVHWLGLLGPLMAVLAIILVRINRVKLCWIPGLVGVFGVLYPFIYLVGFFTGTFDLALLWQAIEDGGQYGGLVMGGGALLLLIAAARAALPAR